MSEPAIALEDVAVELGGRPILRGIDLTVTRGEVVAVLGANGSGKSTLVRTMLGLVGTVRGEVQLFGTTLNRFREWRRIGFVPQRAAATTGVPATVAEVVAAGRLTHRRPFLPMSRADRTAIRQALVAVGLDGRQHDGCSTLSGGQQQRVLIARALAGEPELLVLDEPTAGVDVHSQQAFAQALQTLVDRGATIVLVAHELGPLAGLVGRTVVMRDGRVGYDGPPLDVFTDADGAHAHAGQASHTHHAEDLARPEPDHTPHVTSPLDPPSRGGAR